jgi:hypothetical protein
VVLKNGRTVIGYSKTFVRCFRQSVRVSEMQKSPN